MADPQDRGWLTTRLLPGGEEPDPRFTLANERTFLAWIRTGLAFLAGGIALEAFAGSAFGGPLRQFVALAMIGLGMAIGAGAAVRWARVESRMRRNRPLPAPAIIPVLTLGAAAVSAAIIGLILRHG